MTVCTLTLNFQEDIDVLKLSDEDRINIRTLLLLVHRFQIPKVKHEQLWQVWYDIDLATCLENNGIGQDAARSMTTDLRALEITTLSDLGKLSRDILDSTHWAERTKLLIWRLSRMVQLRQVERHTYQKYHP